ncbi:hypothetical protein C6502_17665 [Candidatus Poribacteria bacterium]|nr:MAG: hypothetical protein C6502_17665 [Candidatus Poribacteria bacterium]
MRPRFYTVLAISLAAMFLAGCSVRTVPLEEDQRIYEDEVGIYDSLPPGFLYDAWQLSQYRHYYGDASELGYRMNIDPNPHDSYRADEKPVQRAPAQQSIQEITPNRRVGERRDRTPTQRTVTRSRTRSDRIASDSTDDRRRVREQLRQRPRQRATNTEADGDRESQRRTTRRRARR